MSSRFLLLPREVRDIVYDFYVSSEDGYTYNFETNQLLQADGNNIDLSLVSTCRQIASEMGGLALAKNPITFSTFFSETTRERAGHYHLAFVKKRMGQTMLLATLAPRLLTSRMAHEAAHEYPRFASILDRWSQREHIEALVPPWVHCGEAQSCWAEFVEFTLHLLIKHEDFLKQAESMPRFWCPALGCRAMELCRAFPNPWILPDTGVLEELTSWSEPKRRPPRYLDHLKYSYSAASVAIRFLDSVPVKTRTQIRNIVLKEDYESVARPASHGRGLISFCLENPRLRIQRFVSLWSNVFPVAIGRKLDYVDGRPEVLHMAMPPDSLKDNKLAARVITKSVGEWIAECLLLPTLGMPEHSFTLVLDGNAVPEATTVAFDIVQRDATWQTALDMCYARGLLTKPSWHGRRLQKGYMYEGLPKAIGDISENSALIRCNFNPGMPHNPEAMIEARSGWSLEDWEQDWATHEPQEFETEAPLPPWPVLRWQRVLP